MDISEITWKVRDNGGRRSGKDRRYFSYSDHIPERRRGDDRRVIEDRRSGLDRRSVEPHVISVMEEQRIGVDRRSAWN